MESRLQKYYFDLMKTKLVINTEKMGHNWQSKIVLPTGVISAIASTPEEAEKLAIKNAENRLVSGELLHGSDSCQGSKNAIAILLSDWMILEKVYLDKKAQYHIENRQHNLILILTEALRMNRREGRKHVQSRKYWMKEESKKAAMYLKKTQSCLVEEYKKKKEVLGFEHIFEVMPKLFEDFCDKVTNAARNGKKVAAVGALALDPQGEIEHNGERYTLIE